MTQTEVLRLALEALEQYKQALDAQTGVKPFDRAITAIKAALANEALERKAENARELGLDYESGYSTGFMDGAIKAQEANCEPTRCTPNCEALLQKIVTQRKPLVFGLNDDGQFTFSVGVQTFTLDYFPENDEETEFMKRQLTHAIEAAHGIKGKA
jgi:hypothetical protein